MNNGEIEMLSYHITYDNTEAIINVVYRPANVPSVTFMNSLKTEISSQPSNIRKIVVGDFNLDQLLQTNKDLVTRYAREMSLIQKVDYSTHIRGGIIDLVLDSEPTGTFDWIPSAFSDHYCIFYDVH